ncbi:MAG TPA: hypothetical protein VG755_02885 [Nannocystaceae bacterium]|nr:hypothetical protein [Nannocystaceae bacterium]
MRRIALGSAVAFATACGSGGGGGGGESTGTSSGGGGIMTIGEGGPKLDALVDESGTGAGEGMGELGCEKVDFLFVIDSSHSMETNQAALIASFPEFVSAIQGTLTDVSSYHVAVVTSDAYEFNDPQCTEIGASVTQTDGENSNGQTCTPFATSARFLTDEDDLPTQFACIAQVGTDGDNDERMLAAATAALSPELNAAGGCNEGFLRDDALLVMVLITDEDDPGTCVNGNESCNGSPGDPMEWFEEVVARKGDHPENAVVLSLTRGAPGNVCGPAEGTEKNGARVMEFALFFGPTGLVGDICQDSFGAFFDEAVGLIDSACGGFIPPVG